MGLDQSSEVHHLSKNISRNFFSFFIESLSYDKKTFPQLLPKSLCFLVHLNWQKNPVIRNLNIAKNRAKGNFAVRGKLL